MPDPGAHLKLIALLLPEPLATRVEEEQQRIAVQWGPCHALRTPPHITLIPPVSVTHTEWEQLKQLGNNIAGETEPFELSFQRFGAFPPRVVFIQLLPNEHLKTLYRRWRTSIDRHLPHVLNRYPNRPYHPHLTLAHRDVGPEQFKAIWVHYSKKGFTASAAINSFFILKHRKTGWFPEVEFPCTGDQSIIPK